MRIYDSFGIVKTGAPVIFANPSGLIGMTAANGVAQTAARSDATHAIDPAIAPVWTGQHVFSSSASEMLIPLRNTTSGADLKNVLIRTGTGGQFQIWSATDAAPLTAVTPLITSTRVGAAWATLVFANTTDNPTISFNGTGAMSFTSGTATFPARVSLTRTGSTLANAALTINATTNPSFVMNQSGAVANNQQWERIIDSEQLIERTVNDANNVVVNWLVVDRTGTAVDSITFPNSPVKLSGGYTVAGLPAGVVGQKAYVTNALAPAFGANVAGGGAVTIPVFYNGANWIVG